MILRQTSRGHAEQDHCGPSGDDPRRAECRRRPSLLEQQAKKNPTAFLALVGKLLPLQVGGAGGGPILYQVVTGVPRSPGDEGAAS